MAVKKVQRTTKRVESTEPQGGAGAKKVIPSPVKNGKIEVVGGEAFCSFQMSETVPVAQYANVIIGPVGIQKQVADIDIEALIEVDWDSTDPLTERQEAAFDRAVAALRGMSKVVQTVIAEDRESVLESVRQHNAREAAQAKEERKTSTSRKR